MITKNSVITDH